MADCKINNQAVLSAVDEIQKLAGQYASTGETFVTAFHTAINDMEGAAKDALLELFDKSYKDFVSSNESGIPAMITGLATLLEGNRKNFDEVDSQIAESIRNGGQ